MNTGSKSVILNCSIQKASDYLKDIKNLPQWAIKFAKEVREEGGKHVVVTPGGLEIPMEIKTNSAAGTIDFWGTLGEVTAVSPSRLISLEDERCVYVFTTIQLPGMPDEAFAQQVEGLSVELDHLKSHLEAA